MKKINSLVNVSDNENSNIQVNIGEVDQLSPLSIYKNKDVKKLEDEFSDRIDYSCDILGRNILPRELKDEFEIKPNLVNNRLVYNTVAKTKEAYEKFPRKLTFSMNFKDKKTAEEFKKNGIKELEKKANITRKPVKIPNIVSMEDKLGEYLDPTSYVNKYGSKGSELYLLPKPFPAACEYIIKIINNKLNFEVSTKLRLSEIGEDFYMLNNSESSYEPFDISLKIFNLNFSKNDKEMMSGKLTISISLRKEYEDDCKYNLDILKYLFLADDNKSRIIIKNVQINKNVFNFSNCDKQERKEKGYNYFKRLVDLIEKVIYIEEQKDIKFKFDIDDIIKNEQYINLLMNEINGENYTISVPTVWNLPIKDYNKDDILREDGKLGCVTKFDTFSLMGAIVPLKEHRVILENCKIISLKDKKNKNGVLKVSVPTVLFEIVK